ncbi:MAG: hypothetical protein ABJF10_15995 [Chthoniobacter sp.]|uniref:hypothetical protein n=1 Tax=Chthoniobacter sp. TaxID=2510640 RepID=UPI0032A3A761
MDPSRLTAYDPIAVSIVEHLREMQSGGYGELVIERKPPGVLVGFGGVWARGENDDIALVCLASAILNDPRLGGVFLQRIRGSVPMPNHSPAG